MTAITILGAAHMVAVSYGSSVQGVGVMRRAGEMSIDYGGTGYNIAMALATRGQRVRLGTLLADSSIARIITHSLEAANVSVMADYRSDLSVGGLSAHLNDAGEPTSIIYSNPASKVAFREDYLDELVAGAGFLVLDASLHIETLVAVAIAAGRQRIPVWLAGISPEEAPKVLDIVDAGGRIDAFFVNSEELRVVVETMGEYSTPQMLALAIGGLVVETRGHRGAAVWSSKQSSALAATALRAGPSKTGSDERDLAGSIAWLGAGDHLLATALYRHVMLGERLPIAVCAASEEVTRDFPLRREVAAYTNAFERRVRELQDESDSAFVDALTHLVNRRGFDRFCRVKGEATPAAVLMVDIDHFKKINDSRGGHAVGDQVLADLGKILADAVRVGDCACRMGGEEFVILMPLAEASESEEAALEKILQGGAELAERIRRRVEDFAFVCGAVTCSVGVAAGRIGDLEAVLHQADKAVYRAKESGRNQVVVAGQDQTAAATVAAAV